MTTHTTMTTRTRSTEKRTCPCKTIPLSLSSFTAAEYGDLTSLSKLGRRVATRRDDAGYTPLHYAAQHNHVAACALLLQMGCPLMDVDDDDNNNNNNNNNDNMETTKKGCGATPLHRAAFAGATASMRVLLEWNDRNDDDHYHHYQGVRGPSTSPERRRESMLLARDWSFGDQMTPLHKAAAGGRFLAVHMLLEALRRGEEDPQEEEPSTTRTQSARATRKKESGRTSLLQRAMEARDAFGRRPRDVARYYAGIQVEEQKAVARWDEVAGGVADWEKCVQLLEQVPMENNNGGDDDDDDEKVKEKYDESLGNKSCPVLNVLPELPSHLRQRGVMACLHCDVDDSGRCLTSIWATAFQNALCKSASLSLGRGDATTTTTTTTKTNYVSLAGGGRFLATKNDSPVLTGGYVGTGDSSRGASSDAHSSTTKGMACGFCHKPTVALYPRSDGTLICKRCKRMRLQ